MLSKRMINQDKSTETQLQYETPLKYITLTRWTLMMKYFVKEWRKPLLLMTKIMNWWLKETNMDFQIRGLPHSVVKHAQSASARNSIHKIGRNAYRHAFLTRRTKKSIIQSFELKKKRFGMLETSICANCTRRNPKRKFYLSCWNIGIVYCTCGHFLRKGKTEIHQIHDGRLFHSWLRHKERTTSRTPIR